MSLKTRIDEHKQQLERRERIRKLVDRHVAQKREADHAWTCDLCLVGKCTWLRDWAVR